MNATPNELTYLKMIQEVDEYAIIFLDTHGNIATWNKGAEMIKGYTEAEIIGQNFRIFYPYEDRQTKLPEALLDEAAKKGNVRHEGWRVRKNGSRFWGRILITAIHDDNNSIIGFTKVTADITEAKRNAEKLRHSEERFQKMIRDVQEYAIISLDRNGCIEHWNKGAEQIEGYTAAEIIGSNFKTFYPKEDQLSKLPEILLEQALREGSATYEGWRIRKDGSAFWGFATISATYAQGGEISGFIEVTRDLTDVLAAGNAIKDHNTDLQIKNNELEQFVYIASHDLQEPLFTVINFIQLLQAEYSSTFKDNESRYFTYISESALRMRELIKGLLDFARLGKVKTLTRVDCNKIMSSIQVDLSLKIESTGAKIHVDPLPVIDGYETELRQLFQNLIGNALKFTKDDVPVEIIVSAEKRETEWRFSVKDNGIGIPARFKDKIFLIFQRLHTREKYEGNGIGLAHCKKIVELHNGRIEVLSEPGNGATFYFTIPNNIMNEEI